MVVIRLPAPVIAYQYICTTVSKIIGKVIICTVVGSQKAFYASSFLFSLQRFRLNTEKWLVL